MCVQISISGSAFREPNLGTPFSLSVPGACVLSPQRQTWKQPITTQCTGGSTPVMTKVLGGSERGQLNVPQRVRKGFSEKGWVSWEGCSRQREQQALAFPKHFQVSRHSKQNQGCKVERACFRSPQNHHQGQGVARPSSCSKCLLQE